MKLYTSFKIHTLNFYQINFVKFILLWYKELWNHFKTREIINSMIESAVTKYMQHVQPLNKLPVTFILVLIRIKKINARAIFHWINELIDFKDLTWRQIWSSHFGEYGTGQVHL